MRQHRHVETFLNGFKGTLLSDGYAAYEKRATARAIPKHPIMEYHTDDTITKP